MAAATRATATRSRWPGSPCVGPVVELHDDARDAALRTYRDRHPDAFYAAFADFRLYRLDVASVRYVGGFGRMSWVPPTTTRAPSRTRCARTPPGSSST